MVVRGKYLQGLLHPASLKVGHVLPDFVRLPALLLEDGGPVEDADKAQAPLLKINRSEADTPKDPVLLAEEVALAYQAQCNGEHRTPSVSH